MTKNEKRLRTIILRQRVQIHSLRKKSSHLKTYGQQSKFDVHNVFGSRDDAFNNQLSTFFAHHMRLSSCKKFGHRFATENKNFALSLYFCGPKAYSFCQRYFTLPSKRVWLARLDIKAGFCDSVISLLGRKVCIMDKQNRECILLLDEMSLKTKLSYDAAM